MSNTSLEYRAHMVSEEEENMGLPAEDLTLETADAVARAAHLWIRALCLNVMQEPEERQALASGLVAGLCDRLELDPRIRELVAYVYALLDNEGALAVPVARDMLRPPQPTTNRGAYEKGRSEAAGIVEMLAYHRGGR